LDAPLKLTRGVDAPALFAAVRDFSPTLRQHGHIGIAIEDYVWDRGAIGGLAKLCRARHIDAVRQLKTEDEIDPALLYLTEWFLLQRLWPPRQSLGIEIGYAFEIHRLRADEGGICGN
jgi:hypothetical protein